MHIERFSQAHHQLEAVYIVFKQPRAKWRAEKKITTKRKIESKYKNGEWKRKEESRREQNEQKIRVKNY